MPPTKMLWIFLVSCLLQEALAETTQEKKLEETELIDLFGKSYLKLLKREKKDQLPPNILLPNPEGVDLRKFASHVEDQGRYTLFKGPGSSLSFAITSALEIVLGQNSLQKDLSERHLSSLSEIPQIEKALHGATQRAITQQEFWPNDADSPKPGHMNQAIIHLKSYAYLGDNLKAMIAELEQGHPLVLALSTPVDMQKCEKTISSLKSTSKAHAVAVVGHKSDKKAAGGGYFILKNSYGKDCGDEGYHYLPFAYCKRYHNYCMAFSLYDWEITSPKPIQGGSEFYSNDISLSVDTIKKWYSNKRTVYFNLNIPEETKKMIKSVTYNLKESSIGEITVTDPDSDYEWSFTTTKKNYSISYTLHLVDNRTFTYEEKISL